MAKKTNAKLNDKLTTKETNAVNTKILKSIGGSVMNFMQIHAS